MEQDHIEQHINLHPIAQVDPDHVHGRDCTVTHEQGFMVYNPGNELVFATKIIYGCHEVYHLQTQKLSEYTKRNIAIILYKEYFNMRKDILEIISLIILYTVISSYFGINPTYGVYFLLLMVMMLILMHIFVRYNTKYIFEVLQFWGFINFV